MKPFRLYPGSLLIGALASTPILHAAPTVEETFLTGGADYTEAAIVGQGPTVTGFTGAWLEAYGGAESPVATTTNLSYSSVSHTLGSAGGSVEYGAAGNGRVGRLLTAPYNNATKGDVYFAVIIQLDEVNAVYRGLEFHNGGFDDGGNRVLQIVSGEGGSSNFNVRLFNNNDDGFLGDLGTSDIDENLFVGKISFSDLNNSDSIKVWRNPSNLDGEYFSGPADFEKSDFNIQFDRVSFARFGGGAEDATIIFDEIRFGSTWQDVTTIASPDTDADGLPDDWETQIINAAANEGPPVILTLADIKGPNDSPATSDYDADGSNDDAEFVNMTNPTDPDTDDDGLNDGDEAAAGSDPHDRDSDDDTLTDGDEVNIYDTNPIVQDTDGDLENDGFEVFQGTDPKLGGELSNSTALGLVQVNGNRDAQYGGAKAVQTNNTTFGDNFNELDAAYGKVKDGKLYILLTGNLQDNFNKLDIFIDSKAGGQDEFDSAGNDNSDVMNGMFFDVGFLADYHLIARRGFDKFDLDFADLDAQTSSSSENILSFGSTGYGSSGTGVNATPIRVGYDGSNTGGVGAAPGVVDQVAAAAVTTGLELCIDLADLGSPTGPIRVMAVINNQDHTFMSNQILGGLPIDSDNLADPAAPVELDMIAGDQFFTIPLVEPVGDFAISDVQIIGGNQLQLTVDGLTIGNSYKLQSSTNLKNDASPGAFADIPASTFTAAAASEVRTVAVTPGSVPKLFVRAADAP